MSDHLPPGEIPSPSSCVSGSLIGATQDGTKVRVIPLFCHKWSCPFCRKHNSAKWRAIAESGDPERFITLTLRANEKLSPQYQAKIIKNAFSRLVEKARKKFGTFEYMLVFELTKKGTPHIHVLQRGEYVPKGWLSSTWKALTGSFVVDIKAIKSKKDVSRYIMKYMGKAIADVHRVLQGMRILQRSKKWVIEKTEEKDSTSEPVEDNVLGWHYVSITPREVFEYAHDVLGWDLHECRSSGTISIMGPPDVEIIDRIIEPLLLERV